jgi:ribosome-associated protein
VRQGKCTPRDRASVADPRDFILRFTLAHADLSGDVCQRGFPTSIETSRTVGYHSGMTDAAQIDDVPIGGEDIRLGQFLKFAGLLESGGDVKEAIIDGYVRVNGEVDRRRGRQLQLGDVVTFAGRGVRVCR